MSANDDDTTASIRQFMLEKESELRVEVGPEATLRLRLTAGAAEVFGAELPPGKWITVPALRNIAIFTWKGATIELDGISEVEYVADETPMVSYVNVHAILDGRRTRARTGNGLDYSQGPRTIVVGPTDSGKSSLCRMLLNWACKRSWKPTFVDLDIGQGSITMPGCIAASSVEMPMDAFWGIPTEMPVVYFYGHTSEKLYSMLKDVLKSKPHVDIVKLHKSEGVVLRNQKVRQMSRSYRIREYFYGLNNDLSPYSLSMNFGDISVYRIGGPQAPRSALPIGAEPLSDPTRAVMVNINYDLVHAILAISYAKESDQILSSNIAGFLYVAEIDFESKRITFLAPCPGELPSKLLLMGTLKWFEN